MAAAPLVSLPALAAQGTTVTTAVGLGSGFEGDGGPAVEAGLEGPRMVAFDGQGGYYVADTYHHVIRHVDAAGTITTLAGTPEESGFRDGPADQALFDAPHGIDVTADGDVLVGDPVNDRIRRVDVETRMVTTIAGTGDGGYRGDGGPATDARLDQPKVVLVGPDGGIYIADFGNDVIRRVDPATGHIETWAGEHDVTSGPDGVHALESGFAPRNVAFDVDNDLLIADRDANTIRSVDWETRIITTIAGSGDQGSDGDGGDALEAELDSPRGLGVDWAGNVYIADSDNNRVRKVDVATGIITTAVGDPEGDGGRKDGDLDEARLNNPRHVIFDEAGNLYIADTGNDRIRMVADFVAPRPSTTTTSTTTTTTTTTPTTAPPGPDPDPGAGPGSPGSPSEPVARSGYWMLGSDGVVFDFGDAASHGSGGAGSVDVEPTPSGEGYWIVDGAGRVSAHGDALHHGAPVTAELSPGEVVTSLSATPTGAGYWVFTDRGRALAFGDAVHRGDMSAVALNGPVLDSIPTPSGEGYYMVASDGGIFSFGDARFHGSMGGIPLNEPVQSLVPDGDGVGYWLVASDGGVFAFEAPFRGSMGDTPLNRPISGMVAFGDGYLMVGEDGGIFNFSDRPFHGSLGANPPPHPIIAVAPLG